MEYVIKLRALSESDVSTLVEINNSGYPGVPMEDAAQMGALLEMSSLALGALDDNGELIGFVLALDSGQNYQSENYVFFESQFRNHFYIDRIVLSADARGLGAGSALYEAIFDHARKAGLERITCEVNIEPPNPGSLRFHRRWGFEDVATQATKGGSVLVQLLQAPLV